MYIWVRRRKAVYSPPTVGMVGFQKSSPWCWLAFKSWLTSTRSSQSTEAELVCCLGNRPLVGLAGQPPHSPLPGQGLFPACSALNPSGLSQASWMDGDMGKRGVGWHRGHCLDLGQT